MPFALNESTRFISPTKTPEYLAGGRPVVSTPITDVVRTYGDTGIVRIADSAEAFVAATEAALADAEDRDGLWPRPTRSRATCPGITPEPDEGEDAMRDMSPQDSNPERLGAGAGDQPQARRRGFDYLIVGAGFAGSVLAERLATGLNKRVLVVDRRPHIAGNAYDYHDESGVLIHRYGPHIFHTNAQRIVDYLAVHRVAPLRTSRAGAGGWP